MGKWVIGLNTLLSPKAIFNVNKNALVCFPKDQSSVCADTHLSYENQATLN